MSAFDDLTGKRFGRLTVICRASDYVQPNGHHKTRWKCKCDCGNEVIAISTHLKNGHCQSCGCLSAELSAQRLTERNKERAKHGKWESPIYTSYRAMISRCYNENDVYHRDRYMNRGIYICEEWYDPNSDNTIDVDKFREFYNWSMMNGYAPGLTIDRIDNDGPYAPWNCRWATPMQQSNNLSTNYIIAFNGQNFTIGQLAYIFGVDYKWLYETLSRNNFNIYNLFGYVQTPYGQVFTLTNWRGEAIPVHPIYFINRYGFYTSCDDYTGPELQPALWLVDDKGFISEPLIDDPNEM